MRPQICRLESNLAYLEPPHSHDPESVSTIAALPVSVVQTLPASVQKALYDLEQSTSIVYASYERLQELLEERFDRLMPSTDADGEISFSEPSFLNYINSLRAEKTYLISDAHPDWRHKASLARVAIQPYGDLLFESANEYPELPSSVHEWWSCLQSAVASWCEYAKIVHVPDYEDTISEYMAIQKHAPSLTDDLDESPLETPVCTPTPMSEQEPDSFQIYGMREDLPSPALTEQVAKSSLIVSGFGNSIGSRRCCNTTTDKHLPDIACKACNNRKDSGVGLEVEV